MQTEFQLGDDEGSELGSLDVSFDSSSDGNLEGLLIGDSLEYQPGPEFGSYLKKLQVHEDVKLDGSLMVNHWYILMGLYLDAMKALNFAYLMVKC